LDFVIDEGEDPFTRLGVGMVTYFALYRSYIFFFLLMTIVSIPLWFAFRTNSVLVAPFALYSLGSLGEAQTLC